MRNHVWRKYLLAVLAGLISACLFSCAQVATPVPRSGNPSQDLTGSPVPTRTASTKFTQIPLQTGTPQKQDDITPTVTPDPTTSETPPASGTSTPLACLQSGGRTEMGSFRSDRLKLPMEYRIWLPPCYDEQAERSYPVLYMIHGQNYNEDQWDRLGIDETAGSLISAGELPPFIIALPRDRNWSQPEDDPFGEVMVEGFIPWVDSTYRTIADPDHRAVGGLSRGAGWAVHLGLSRPDLFGAIGAHSLPVFWTDTPRIHRWLDAIPSGETPRIYLDIGDRDRPQILASARWFEELLTERGVPHVWHLFSGFHEEAYWQKHLEKYLRWYAAPWENSN